MEFIRINKNIWAQMRFKITDVDLGKIYVVITCRQFSKSVKQYLDKSVVIFRLMTVAYN